MTQPRSRFFARLQPERTSIRVESANPTSGVASLRLYDAIDSWGGEFGVSAREFSDVIEALPEDTTEIRLHIHSPGGEAYEALAMLNTLRAHPATVTAIVDGLAASAASLLAVGADKTVMMPNSELMLHNPWALCVGGSEDMTKAADMLDRVSANLADIYAAKSGASPADMRAVMQAETWLSDQESVDAGLADEIAVVTKDSPQPKVSFDLSAFRYQGRAQAPNPKTPVAQAPGHTSKEGDADMAFLDDVRQKLGVADAEADEGAILAALDEALSERAEPEIPVVPVASVIPEGFQLVPQDTLDALKASADKGELAYARQMQSDRDSAIKAAVSDGRIPPASRESWQTRWEKDPEGTPALLDSLPKNLVPLAARGHEGGVGDEPEFGPGWADELFKTEVS